jgi:flagellar biosynthesis protein FlhF
MNIQRFTAPTSREALAKARMAFGEGTLILSNRPTENGVEVVATAEDTLSALDAGQGSAGQNTSGRNGQFFGSKPKEPSYQEVASQVEEDANQLAMSTLSFQDYVRERMARRRQESMADAGSTGSTRIAPSEPAEPLPRTAPVVQERKLAEPGPVATRPAAAPAVTNGPRKANVPVKTAAVPQGIERELHAMKELIEDRFNTLNWLGQARQNPIQSNLMLKLIRAGYSPTLSRTILERMPEAGDAAQSMQWVIDVLERNLHTDAAGAELHEEGGVFALIGATGVGKTTTAAKLAGLCAAQHGASSVGLITLDTYRVGAQEQLRAYGKMLGVVAHIAHDRAALQDLLGLLSNKKMVLIDTTGLAPRDPRKRQMMELLDIPGVKRLLVLNAGGHGDTLEDTVSHFKSSANQQVIFSKIDEAVKLGPAIDAAIRHQLVLRGVTTGQSVPEDWESANAEKLVRASLRASGNSAYDPKMSDLGFIFSNSNDGAFAPRGMLNA